MLRNRLFLEVLSNMELKCIFDGMVNCTDKFSYEYFCDGYDIESGQSFDEITYNYTYGSTFTLSSSIKEGKLYMVEYGYYGTKKWEYKKVYGEYKCERYEDPETDEVYWECGHILTDSATTEIHYPMFTDFFVANNNFNCLYCNFETNTTNVTPLSINGEYVNFRFETNSTKVFFQKRLYKNDNVFKKVHVKVYEFN